MYVCTYIEYKEKSCCLTSKETAFYYFGPTPQGGERRGIEEWQQRPQWVGRERGCMHTNKSLRLYLTQEKERERGSKAMETVHNIYYLPPPPYSLWLPLLIPLYKPLGTLCKFLSASTMGHWRRGREREWTGSLKGFRTGGPMTSVLFKVSNNLPLLLSTLISALFNKW